MPQKGNFKISILSDGLFRLDGGAMFGIVPKPVWERFTKADGQNRIQLALNPLLIQTDKENIIVDTGIGNKYDEKFNSLYAIDHTWTLPNSLKNAGLSTKDITYVIPSHLHFDHMGGATIKEMGRLTSTFPNATYIIQEEEWENAQSNNPRNKGSYLIDDFNLLEKNNQIKLINGDIEPVKGVEAIKTGGHTPGHQIIKIKANGSILIYAGDLIPTSSHLKPAWCMGYDLFPLEVAGWKTKFLEDAAKNGWILLFDHEVESKAARIIKTEKGYVTESVNI